MKKQREFKVQILGVRVDFLTIKEALEWVEEQVKYNKVGQITTPNPEQVVLAQKDEEFRRVLNEADLNICDGIGLVWAAKRKLKIKSEKLKVVNRLSGIDLMLEMCKLAGKKKWKIMLMGGKDGTAEKAARSLEFKIKNYELRIMFDNGALNIKKESKKEREEIISKINKFKPNLLFVAYGAPWQEKWIAKNLPKLKINVAMGVGGTFDYISGWVGRAPQFVRKIGLEWLWRLVREPWRIKRQLSLVRFLWLLLYSQ